MGFTVAQALKLDVFRQAQVVAGHAGLDRVIRWVHIVDIPDVPRWLHGGELLLTTGYSWPNDPQEQTALLNRLAGAQLAGIAFAIGQYWSDVPKAIRTYADDLRLPIIQLPWEIPFVDVTEAVHSAILRMQYELYERSESIHRALTAAAIEAADLQTIATVLAHLIQKTVSFTDSSFRLLARCAWDRQTDLVDEALEDQRELPPNVRRTLHQKGLALRLRRATRAVHIEGMPELGLVDRIVCPIRISGELVGYVWVLESDRGFLHLDIRAAEHAATVAALQILRQRSIEQAEARVRHSFVDALISGQVPEDAGAFLERGRLMGFDPRLPHAVLLATLVADGDSRQRALASREELGRRERLGQAIRTALEEAKLPILMTQSLNRVLAVLPVPSTRAQLRATVQRLCGRVRELQPGLPVLFTLGAPHPDVQGVQLSYREADAAANFVAADSGLACYEDLLIMRLIHETASHQVLHDLFAATLGRLQNVRSGDCLRQTVEALVRNQFRKAETAKDLHVHRNTLEYRLKRIEALLETPLSDPELRLRLQLAVAASKVLDHRRAAAASAFAHTPRRNGKVAMPQ